MPGHDAEPIAPLCIENGVSMGPGRSIGGRGKVRDSVLPRKSRVAKGSTIVGQVVA